jgi:uncharacterized protein YdbL (DUF1318 family)
MAGALGPGDLALAAEASGLDEPDRAELRRVLADLAAADAPGGTPAARARRLLEGLHARALRTYEERATTLRGPLRAGRFNCVSATALYLLAGVELGLEVKAELLPTHARARVWSPARAAWVVVETTSPSGFDPPPEVARAMAARFTASFDGARSLVDEEGLRVGLPGLLAAMHANRGALAQAAGDLEAAETHFAAAEALTKDARMRGFLRAQRASLLSRLATEAADRDGARGLEPARDLLLVAVSLAAEERALLERVRWNLEAVTQRLVDGYVGRGEEAEAEAAVAKVRSHLEPSGRARLDAFVLSERAGARLAAGAYAAGVRLLDRALSASALPDELRAVMAANRLQGVDAAMEAAAAGGDLEAAYRWLDRRAELSPLRPEARRARAARLGQIAGHHFVDAGDLEEAAARFRACERAAPGGCVKGLVAALENLVAPRARAGDCAAVGGWLEELAAIGRSEGFVASARQACAAPKKARRPAPKDGPPRRD